VPFGTSLGLSRDALAGLKPLPINALRQCSLNFHHSPLANIPTRSNVTATATCSLVTPKATATYSLVTFGFFSTLLMIFVLPLSLYHSLLYSRDFP
jgi:hypothetical protein